MAETRRQLRDLTTIADIGLKLTSEQSVEAVGGLVAFYGGVLLEAQRTALMLIEPSRGRLDLAETWGQEADEPGPRLLSDESAALRRFLDVHHEALVVHAAERGSWPFLDPEAPGDAIVVPIVGARSPVGVLIVEDRMGHEPFAPYDAELLDRLVAQAAIAIENARLYEHLDSLVAQRTAELEVEKNKSERLLLNILPADILSELKQRGRVTPRRCEAASILFTDFVGFTSYAEKLEPEELLDDLEANYALFDEIVQECTMETLKTIGDAYMCTAGVPNADPEHAANAVRAGLRMVEAVAQLKVIRAALGQGAWDVRVGVHSGPLVAGIVGRNKFAFDVWGDTVNLASRMESHGVVNRVNVSAATYGLVKDRFEFEHRGRLPVKGAGELDMYLAVRELD